MIRAVPGERDIAWVEGADAERFLQGLLSSDVASLAVGSDARSLLLDVTGHVTADLRVARTAPEEFTLVTGAREGADLVAALETYLFSEDVTILGPEPSPAVTLLDASDRPAPTGADLIVAGDVPGTWEVLGSSVATLAGGLGAELTTPDALEPARIAAGIGRFGTDFTPANLVHEAGLENLAVSFDKGCFLGQETVARVQYRGQVNRRLVGIALPSPVPAGASVVRDEKVVGTLTSTATHPELGPIGLAILRREAAAGDAVLVDTLTTPAQVVGLPFTERSQTAA